MTGRLLRQRPLLLSCMVLVASGLVFLEPSSASEPTGSLEYSPAEKMYAALLHISVDDAAQRLHSQTESALVRPSVQLALGDAYGDWWTDIASGHQIIGFAGPNSPSVGDLLPLIGDDLAKVTEIRQVQWSKADLDSVTNTFAPLISDSNAGASVGLGSSQTPDTNRVNLLIPQDGDLTAAQRTVVALASTAYADKISIKYIPGDGFLDPTACSAAACDPPLRGGNSIRAESPNAYVVCTLGFITRSNTDGKYYALTAGHCLYDATAPSSIWQEEFTNGAYHDLGPGHSYEFGSAGDDGIVSIANPTGWALGGTTYWWYYNQSDQLVPITSYGGSGLNDYVCAAGTSSATISCGTVSGLNQIAPYPGHTVNHLGTVAQICPLAGDSGGPVVDASLEQARGIMSGVRHGSADCFMYFQGITDALGHRHVYIPNT